jgi:hypothetical protein
MTSLALAPPPALLGYRMDEEQKASWMREFTQVMPYAHPPALTCNDHDEDLPHPPSSKHVLQAHPVLPVVTRAGGLMAHASVMMPRRDTVHDMLATVNQAIKHMNKETLQPTCPPCPNGTRWWNNECSVAHTLTHTVTSPEEWKRTAHHLKYTVTKAKHEWAYKQLHEAEDARDIWRMASICKGRRSNIFPALRSTTGHLTHNPEEKATFLKQQFFLDEPRVVEEAQPSDPLPRPTRTWSQITMEEVTLALSTAKNSSAPGPSGVGYTMLKWIHQVRPDVLTDLYNNCLDASIHPWKEVTVVVINKLGKPDYSTPKAYQPISLLECMGKLLEKIVTKQFNCNIEEHSLLAMTQFGSRPQHNAVDVVSVLIHCVQATIAMGHVGALLLFDISGFFDNINPARAAHLLTLLGFPTTVCQWTLSFLTG